MVGTVRLIWPLAGFDYSLEEVFAARVDVDLASHRDRAYCRPAYHRPERRRRARRMVAVAGQILLAIMSGRVYHSGCRRAAA